MKADAKNTFRTVLLSLALGLVSVPSWAELNQRSIHEITILCEQLLMDYAIYRDHLDAEGFASILTEDAELHIGGGIQVGTAANRKYITDHVSPPYAHMIMMTSTEIIPLSETQATGIAYAIVLGSEQHVGLGDPPVQAQGIGAANEYHVDFELTDGGWKISRLSLIGLFTGPR
jgi:hypothetical protein